MELQGEGNNDPLQSACAKCCCFCDDLSKYRGDWTPHLKFVAGVFVFFVLFLVGIISFYTLANSDHSTTQYIYLPIGQFPAGKIPSPSDALVVELQWNQINPAPAGTDATARVDFFYPPGEASGFPARPTRSLYFNLGRDLFLMQAGGMGVLLNISALWSWFAVLSRCQCSCSSLMIVFRMHVCDSAIVTTQTLDIRSIDGSYFDFPWDKYTYSFRAYCSTANTSDYTSLPFLLHVSQAPVSGFYPIASIQVS